VLVGIVATVVMMVAGILITWAAHLRAERIKALPKVAAAAGLQFATSDIFGCTAVAFPIFREGDGRKVENVMWRDGINGLPVRVFDYGWYSEHRDTNGQVNRRWQYFSCALAQHNGKWPVIRISRQGLADTVGERLGLRSVDLESEEFNRRFFVQCADRKFATDLLVPQMMELLLSTDGRITFETKGRFLLLTTSRVDAHLMPGLLNVADRFVALVPPLVFELYGRVPDDAGDASTPVGEEGMPNGGLLRRSSSTPTARRWTPQDHQFAPPPDFRRESDPWDPTPGIEHDLDGNVVDTSREDPWGDGRSAS
jgi:hypothetical protein